MKNLIDIFNNVLDKPSRKKKNFVPTFKIKPSSLGGKCERKLYYSSAGVPEDYEFDLNSKKRMKVGDAIHNMLDNAFRESGILVDYVNPDGSVHKKYGFGEETTEFPLECEELFIKNAYTDAVMIIDGNLWVTEYKSINEKGFETLSQAKMEHIIQTVCYWFVFNLKLSEGKFSHIPRLQGFEKAEGVRWLYINKNDTSMREFTMTQGDAIFSQIVERIMKAKSNFEKRTLPEKTPDWCNSCPWRDKCKKNYNF